MQGARALGKGGVRATANPPVGTRANLNNDRHDETQTPGLTALKASKRTVWQNGIRSPSSLEQAVASNGEAAVARGLTHSQILGNPLSF